MVLALIFAVGGLAAGAIGLECIHVMSESKQKTMTGRTGGALMFLAGENIFDYLLYQSFQ